MSQDRLLLAPPPWHAVTATSSQLSPHPSTHTPTRFTRATAAVHLLQPRQAALQNQPQRLAAVPPNQSAPKHLRQCMSLTSPLLSFSDLQLAIPLPAAGGCATILLVLILPSHTQEHLPLPLQPVTLNAYKYALNKRTIRGEIPQKFYVQKPDSIRFNFRGSNEILTFTKETRNLPSLETLSIY